MKHFCLCLCVILAAAASFAESSNRAQAVSHASSSTASSTNDATALEYEKLMEEDDAALVEVERWIRENEQFAMEGAGVAREVLNERIMKRVAPVRKGYEDFLKRNPRHSNAHLAFASFLEEIHDDELALEHMLKAKEADPKNPAAWNNLANYYGHYSPTTNAFTHYEKAIELDPNEAVYYHNFGTTVYLFRQDAMQHYGINEQQVFDKALMLYSNSMRLDPTNFVTAADVALTYYGIKPPRNDAAIRAWNDVLKLADSSLQREGVFIHLARINMNMGNFAEAHKNLGSVTNAQLVELKSRVLRNLLAKENPLPELLTNEPPALMTNLPPASAVETNGTKP
jgi:tetratricopeptide (TPR) repeat protein